MRAYSSGFRPSAAYGCSRSGVAAARSTVSMVEAAVSMKRIYRGGVSDLTALLSDAVARLDAVPDDALGVVQVRRFRPMRIVPAGRAWRLGDVLLTREPALYRTGRTSRAVQPKDFLANKSNEAAERKEYQLAVMRGRFPEGDTVHFGHEPLEPQLMDGVWMLQWSRTLPDLVPLQRYLDDRIRLLTEGA